jgi:hypothetical protein
MNENAAIFCLGKQGYDSPAFAEKIAKKRKRVASRTSYKCKICGKWHIGSSLYSDRLQAKKYKAKKRELLEA